MLMNKEVCIEKCDSYDEEKIDRALDKFADLFDQALRPGQTVLLKPNWIAPHHRHNLSEWISVITHPNVITGVIKNVTARLCGSGRVIVADAPQTDSSFDMLAERMPLAAWQSICAKQGVDFQVIDLREHQWANEGDVIIGRRPLPGDPLGSVEYNLRGEWSEFEGHRPSRLGYYGADYDSGETTAAHSKGNNLYRISRTAVTADVFINIPKWKTHKKAGLTCSLKNLVGVNTYKNFLPHHTQGTPFEGGDQFPDNRLRSSIEVYMLLLFKKLLLKHSSHSKRLIPLKKVGRVAFGKTSMTIRNGNWHGNDTLWRTILDLNKLLLYGNADGTLRCSALSEQKRYITIVDGIVAGEKDGPEAPEPKDTRLIIGGANPVAVDCAAAKLMAFDYLKIPTLRNAFNISHFPLVDFAHDNITVRSSTLPWDGAFLADIPGEECFAFRPHFGWIGHIEL